MFTGFASQFQKYTACGTATALKKKALNYWKFWQWHLLKKKDYLKNEKKKVPTLYFSLFIYFITRVCTCSALALHGVTERDTNARRPFPHCRLIPGSAVSVLALLWDKKKNGKALDRLNITWVSKLDASEIIPNYQLVSLAQWWSGCWRARSSRLPNCLMKKSLFLFYFNFKSSRGLVTNKLCAIKAIIKSIV